jgi:hypothetical protein
MGGFLIAAVDLQPVFWVTMGFLAAIGLLAIVSPATFTALSSTSNRWVDSEKYLKLLDKRIEIDQYVLPYSRWLGVAVILSVALLAAVWR